MTKDETIIGLFRAQLGPDWKVQPILFSSDRVTRIVRFNRTESQTDLSYNVLISPALFEKAVRDGNLPVETLQDIGDAIHIQGGPIRH